MLGVDLRYGGGEMAPCRKTGVEFERTDRVIRARPGLTSARNAGEVSRSGQLSESIPARFHDHKGRHQLVSGIGFEHSLKFRVHDRLGRR